MKKVTLLIILLLIFSSCVGKGSRGFFGRGVNIATDPRTLGTQIDDSIMQKNLLARLVLTNKKHFLTIGVKIIDGRIFVTGKVDDPEEKLQITKIAWETKGARSVKNEIKLMLTKYSNKDVSDFISKREKISKKIIYDYCITLKK